MLHPEVKNLVDVNRVPVGEFGDTTVQRYEYRYVLSANRKPHQRATCKVSHTHSNIVDIYSIHSEITLLSTRMFKKFDSSNDVSTSTPVKSSIQRAIKSQIQLQHPNITDGIVEVLIPKKSSLIQYKVTSHLMLYCQRIEHTDNRVPSDIPILFQHRDGPILPTLKWIHPFCCASKENESNNDNDTMTHSPPSVVPFTYIQVDAGAIPYLIGGANIMCPGLTKPNGSSYMPPDDNDVPGLSKGQGVIIYAENKVYPIAVGVMTMSSLEM